MFKVGDMARLNTTFSLIEKHGNTVYDHSEDLSKFVRGDVVEILKVIDHDGDTLVAIYSYTIKESTVINISKLDPLKGQLGTGDMKIKGGTIKGDHLHTGGMIYGDIKLSF